MTRHVPRADWQAELQKFTNRNTGRETVMDEYAVEVGAQEAESGYPLRGVSFDRRAGQVEIMLGDLNGTERHMTRGINDVQLIDLWTSETGDDIAIRFEREDGVTLLRFTDIEPMKLRDAE
jgi:hypothetical protein